MDLAKLIADAKARQPQPITKDLTCKKCGLQDCKCSVAEIVRGTNSLPALPNNVVPISVTVEVCACGHPEDAHEGGECQILECDCLSWCPPSHEYNINECRNDTPIRGKDADELRSNVVPSLLLYSDVRNNGFQDLDVFKIPIPNDPGPVPAEILTYEIPPSSILEEALVPAVTQLPTADEPLTEKLDNCAHMCETCNNWFSHGLKNKCRFPDMVRYGLCMDCMSGKTQIDPLAEIEETDKGEVRLTPIHQIKVRNDERVRCKDMTIEQLTHHIQFTYKHELELRVRSMEARKMRADLIEVEVMNLPEEEREAFRQELLANQASKTKTKRVPKEKKETDSAKVTRLTAEVIAAGTPAAMGKLVAQWMVKTGKTREEVEAMLND